MWSRPRETAFIEVCFGEILSVYTEGNYKIWPYIYITYSISVRTYKASIRASCYGQPNFENQCTDLPFKNVIQNPW